MRSYFSIFCSLVFFFFLSCKKSSQDGELTVHFVSQKTATHNGGTVMFDDRTKGDVGERSWYFEGGTPETSSEKTPTVTYHNPGRFTVRLTSKNSSGTYTMERDSFILVVPEEGLAALIPFDKGIRDEGPHVLDLTSAGNITFNGNDRFNKTGNTAELAGSGRIVAKLDFGTSDYSVSCWVKSSATKRMMIWQSAGKNGGGDPQSWLRMGDNTTTQYLRFHVGSVLNFGPDGKISDNGWHHLVGVREGTIQKLYLDGVKLGEQSTGSLRQVSTPDQFFKIGAQETATGYSNYFEGYMDDFIVYNRALTDMEVKQLFDL